MFMSHIANLMTCYITRHVPCVSCCIAKILYNTKCMLYNTSQPSRWTLARPPSGATRQQSGAAGHPLDKSELSPTREYRASPAVKTFLHLSSLPSPNLSSQAGKGLRCLARTSRWSGLDFKMLRTSRSGLQGGQQGFKVARASSKFKVGLKASRWPGLQSGQDFKVVGASRWPGRWSGLHGGQDFKVV